TQKPECCGFDSHLSHCEERPGSSNSRAAGCQPEGCGCESRAGRCYRSVVSTAACPVPTGRVRVQILADLLRVRRGTQTGKAAKLKRTPPEWCSSATTHGSSPCAPRGVRVRVPPPALPPRSL